MTFALPTRLYTSASVLRQFFGVKSVRKAVKPASQSACWPALLYTQCRNSFADAGLDALVVMPIPRGTSGCASWMYDQSRIAWSAGVLAIVKRAVGEVRYAATAPPCETSCSCAETPV